MEMDMCNTDLQCTARMSIYCYREMTMSRKIANPQIVHGCYAQARGLCHKNQF